MIHCVQIAPIRVLGWGGYCKWWLICWWRLCVQICRPQSWNTTVTCAALRSEVYRGFVLCTAKGVLAVCPAVPAGPHPVFKTQVLMLRCRWFLPSASHILIFEGSQSVIWVVVLFCFSKGEREVLFFICLLAINDQFLFSMDWVT